MLFVVSTMDRLYDLLLESDDDMTDELQVFIYSIGHHKLSRIVVAYLLIYRYSLQ